MAAYDIVIRNGQVADGTGRKLFAADVALKGDRIAAVEAPGSLKGDNEIDATGKVVAPGFIDVHTHDDTYIIDHPDMAMKASQGVTTVVCGNCGISASPYSRSDIPHLLSLSVKKTEHFGKTFAEFAGKVDAVKPAINGAFLIGHSTLRFDAMNLDVGRKATDTEIGVMRDKLDQALKEGAIGMSSGLFYPPAMAATTDEVAEVARPLGKWGAVYTAHMRDETDEILKAMDETFEIGRRAGAHVVVSLPMLSFLVVHSLVAHKEDRYMLPVLPLLALLLGVAMESAWRGARWERARAPSCWWHTHTHAFSSRGSQPRALVLVVRRRLLLLLLLLLGRVHVHGTARLVGRC